MFCSKCGSTMEEGAKFCLNCGTQTNQNAAQAPQQAPGYTPVQPFQQHSSVDPNQPQHQQTFFNGQQTSVGTSGQVQFKNGGKKKKGCLIAVIAVVAVLILGTVGLYFLGGGSQINNLQMSSDINTQSSLPLDNTSVFNTDSPIVFCTFQANVEPGSLVSVEWWYTEYIGEEEYITSYELETENNGDQLSFSLSRPNNGWPLGKYQARIFVNHEQVETAMFEVK